jgi:hypothetical protein
MEEKIMEEKENNNLMAGENKCESTQTRTQKLYEIGRTLGLAKENIDETIRKKKWIQNCFIIVVALAISAASYALFSRPAHYIGISTQDFNAVGEMMYRSFGRLF